MLATLVHKRRARNRSLLWEVAMKTLLIVIIGLTMIMSPVKQLDACTAPPYYTGEKRANLTCSAGCQFSEYRPTWTCTASTGTYKILVGIGSAGTNGTFVVTVEDLTTSQQRLQQPFTASGVCSVGSFEVELINGHEYELWVDASSTGCSVGEHCWAKMCYNCQGS